MLRSFQVHTGMMPVILESGTTFYCSGAGVVIQLRWIDRVTNGHDNIARLLELHPGMKIEIKKFTLFNLIMQITLVGSSIHAYPE